MLVSYKSIHGSLKLIFHECQLVLVVDFHKLKMPIGLQICFNMDELLLNYPPHDITLSGIFANL